MITKNETKYYQGNTEVSKNEYEKEFSSHSNSVTTETDWWGRERVTTKDCFPFTKTHSDEGFKDDSDSLLGAVGSSVLAPVILSGIVVYHAGKLVYHIATIKKRIREIEELDERMRENSKSFFEKEVENTLSRYNKKLAEYKELFELGILTESEYNAYVQDFINKSNQEIDMHKKYLEESLERYKEKSQLEKVWKAL